MGLGANNAPDLRYCGLLSMHFIAVLLCDLHVLTHSLTHSLTFLLLHYYSICYNHVNQIKRFNSFSSCM
jgi:hypothetical protein